MEGTRQLLFHIPPPPPRSVPAQPTTLNPPSADAPLVRNDAPPSADTPFVPFVLVSDLTILSALSLEALTDWLTLVQLSALARTCHTLETSTRPAVEYQRCGMEEAIALTTRAKAVCVEADWQQAWCSTLLCTRGVVLHEVETLPHAGTARSVERWVVRDPRGARAETVWDVFLESHDVFSDLFGVRRGCETWRCRAFAPGEPLPAEAQDGWREAFERSVVPPPPRRASPPPQEATPLPTETPSNQPRGLLFHVESCRAAL